MPKASISYYCQDEVCIDGKTIAKGEVLASVTLHKDIKQEAMDRVLCAISSGVVKTEKPKDDEKPAESNA